MEFIPKFFEMTWLLFDSVLVPGFTFSFGQLLIGSAIVSLSIMLLKFVFGLPHSGTSYRSGGSGKVRVSDQRRGDEK